MNSVGQYITSVIAACLCCGIFRKLVGDKSASATVINTICGIAITITVISPVVKLRIADISKFTKEIQVDAEAFVQDGIERTDNEIQAIITEKIRAYILEKASSFDCSIDEIEVVLSTDSLPVPKAVTIVGTVSVYGKQQLSELIAKNLGIPKEKQKWIYQN